MSIRETIIPDKLTPGDSVGIAAPSGIFNKERFAVGVAAIEAMGFRVRVPDRILVEENGFAGSDSVRADVFNELIADSDIKAVICARGGYGAMRILDRIDYNLIRNNPKIIAGFSDITALIGAVHERTGLICYHTPVVTSLGDAGEETCRIFESMLKTPLEKTVVAENGFRVRGGSVTGRLAGGNLATLVHLIGTPYMPDLSGTILVLEDIKEPPYKIDRMLTQLILGGHLDNVGGIALGHFTDCGPHEAVLRVLQDRLSFLDIPVAGGFPIGHANDNIPFPLGGSAVLNADEMRLVYSL